VPLRIELAGKPQIECPIRFHSEIDLSLAFAPISTPQGIEITVRRAAEAERTNGEYSIGRDGKQNETTVSSIPSQTIENKQSSQLLSLVVSDYRKYFTPTFLHQLKKPLDEPFLAQLVRAGKGAPVTDFDAPLERLRKRKTPLTSGLILTIAKDLGAAWEARRKAASNDTDPRRARPLHTLEELQRMAAGSDPLEREFAEIEMDLIDGAARTEKGGSHHA
jgi:hypothetical protein